MTTHSGILGWKNLMDKGAWGLKELDMTECARHGMPCHVVSMRSKAEKVHKKTSNDI